MKHLAMAVALAAMVGGSASTAHAALFDPNLEAVLAETGDRETVSTLVYLIDRPDLPALTDQLDAQHASLKSRHEVVVRELQEYARATQGDLLEELDALKAVGVVSDYQPFWIANCIRVDGLKRAIELIAGHESVDVIYLNYPISLIDPVADGGGKMSSGRTPEIGLQAIRAPEVWAMGITGEGVLVSTLDTGVDGSHPALASRWRGLDPAYEGHPEWAFFDPVTNWQFPQDSGTHGTHTMGTVCGGPPGDEIGVAPGAEWIHAAVIDRVSIEQTVADAILAFQWLLDPDENPNTNWDVPAVCSNSWGLTTYHGYPPCDETFWTYLDACEAAGIVILFSAGNEGASGLRRPADRATDDYRTCAVAAVDANDPSWPIASFSSRGPTYCTPDGTAAIKPDIAAPGVDVRSAAPGGGYSYKSGTSMASPHVNGVVALMRQACPDLSVEDIKEIIYQTAYDLGTAGEDNSYGWGMIDAYEAVNMAMDWCGPSPPRAFDGYYEVPVGTPTVLAMQATDYDGGPEQISYIVTSLPADGNTLTDVGNDHMIQPNDLPYTLVDHGNEVLYSPGEEYYGDDEFHFKATDGGEPPDGGESEEATISILVLYGPPEIITETLPDGYVNAPYGPVSIEVEGGQPELVWSLITGEYAEDNLGENQFQTVGNGMGWHADDNSWNYSLPFAFPFFGDLYSSVWVCSNGFLDFASSDDEYTNSDEELIANARIAPMWDDLRTDVGGDIYIDTSVAGQVTFRWDTVTWADGNPCNHSCTLHEDGTIEFHYGSGNDPVTPTVGISKGDGAAYLLSEYNNAANLDNANSLRLYEPTPLPDGLMLSPDGVISGTPTEGGSFYPRVRVVDSLDRSDEAELSLTIEEGVPGDVDGDGDVDTDDLLALLAAWGPCEGCPEDINGDGVVDTADLLTLLANWT